MIQLIESYLVIFVIYSFLGWLIESVSSIWADKKFVNRGFLIGPICPIYGIGATLISLLLSRYDKDIMATFLFSVLICGILEYFTSYILEKWFNARWWDYSNSKFNINGRICLETLVPFGIAGVAIKFFINPFLFKFTKFFNPVVLHSFSIIFLIVFLIDLILSVHIINNLKEIKNELKDNTIEISKKVREILINNISSYKRVLEAFPKIKEDVMFDKWEKVKEKVTKSKRIIRYHIKKNVRFGKRLKNIKLKIFNVKKFKIKKLNFNLRNDDDTK